MYVCMYVCMYIDINQYIRVRGCGGRRLSQRLVRRGCTEVRCCEWADLVGDFLFTYSVPESPHQASSVRTCIYTHTHIHTYIHPHTHVIGCLSHRSKSYLGPHLYIYVHISNTHGPATSKPRHL